MPATGIGHKTIISYGNQNLEMGNGDGFFLIWITVLIAGQVNMVALIPVLFLIWAFYEYPDPVLNSYGAWAKSFLHSLLSNPDYVNEFIQRFATHLNTIYNPERVIHVIDSLRSNRELETPQHIERWGWVSSMTEWEDNVEGMREFAIERPNYVRQHIIDYFNLDDTLELTVDISEPGVGIIQIHDINIQSFPDTGIYFQNIPIRLNAIPNEGYQ